MANNVEDAKKAIAGCSYPPVGCRSYGPPRARFCGNGCLQQANEEVLCPLMMETIEGIENIERIAELPGCDGYLVGSADLAISMGQAPKTEGYAPAHCASVQKVIDFAKRNHQGAGIFAIGSNDRIRPWRQGFDYSPIFVGTCQVMLGAERAVSEFRAGIGR